MSMNVVIHDLVSGECELSGKSNVECVRVTLDEGTPEAVISTAASFTIDELRLNVILSQFRDRGLNCKGLIHSHPAGVNSPSGGDLAYVRKVFANDNNEAAGQFFLPIICDDRMYPYLVRQDAPHRILSAQLRLV